MGEVKKILVENYFFLTIDLVPAKLNSVCQCHACKLDMEGTVDRAGAVDSAEVAVDLETVDLLEETEAALVTIGVEDLEVGTGVEALEEE